MGRPRGPRVNKFAQKKRDAKNKVNVRPERSSEPYQEIVRENEAFFKYYKAQVICPEANWDSFISFLQRNLPTTFRVTSHRNETQALLDIIKGELFEQYVETACELHNLEKDKVEKPLCLPWYPNGLAWQLHLTRKDIRRSEPLFKLHNFLIAETNAGSISRQEAVSMIPPIVLNVKPTDKVLDMCAAPGSKTAQLIEALHSGVDGLPSGFVVANDLDNNRCYMLVHQAKRLNSPCIVVTNHDSSNLPNFMKTGSKGKEVLKFSKILCDVPCSGDGTMRKNPDIWTKWTPAHANNLHGVQYRILRRGAELLEVGGKVVYSTCSLNPVENEAVLQRIIHDSEGSLQIVDVSHLVPGLNYIPGVTTWKVASKDMEIYSSFEDVPEKLHTIIRPTMFPLPTDDINKIGLEKCIRILPHLQDTGAFFVAAIEKIKLLPWERENAKDATQNVDTEVNSTSEEKEAPAPQPQRKRRRMQGYKEDPFVFFKGDEEIAESIESFYELTPEFDSRCLLTRCNVGKKKNIYFCSKAIRDLVECNENNVKIINTGVKTFVRCDNKHMKCAFRLAQEGLFTINAFIGNKRRIDLQKDDLIKLLQCTDPTKPPTIAELSQLSQERCSELDPGSCIIRYKDEKLTLFLVGWRGTSSLRAYTDTNDTIHVLRLLGADLSQFEINKFKKDEKSVENEELQSESMNETVEKDLN